MAASAARTTRSGHALDFGWLDIPDKPARFALDVAALFDSDQYRTNRTSYDRLRDMSQHESSSAAALMSAEHDDIGIEVGSGLQDLRRSCASTNVTGHFTRCLDHGFIYVVSQRLRCRQALLFSREQLTVERLLKVIATHMDDMQVSVGVA